MGENAWLVIGEIACAKANKCIDFYARAKFTAHKSNKLWVTKLRTLVGDFPRDLEEKLILLGHRFTAIEQS